eukprot:TRINITY_DN4677_c3_g1_i1.p1 TRINITY_DN4677_c3_g1~~TRINITY_DN4677_c3_g1_i1.p1  ORF type:complete len:656 (-),score=273.48 TRINITY_DN4677_c3_g1_i1:14-1981(-)
MHLCLGTWEIQDENEISGKSLRNFHLATKYDENSGKSWQKWALANYQLGFQLENRTEVNEEIDLKRAICAMEGLFKAISLNCKYSLENIFRIFKMALKLKEISEISEIVRKNLKAMRIQEWIPMIPTLVSKFNSSHVIGEILEEIGNQFPNAVIFPLMSTRIENSQKTPQLEDLIFKLKSTDPMLWDQVQLLFDEISLISRPMEEIWNTKITELSQKFFQEKSFNLKEYIELHDLLESRDLSQLEKRVFDQEMMNLIHFAKIQLENFEREKENENSKKFGEIMWDAYSAIFRKLQKTILPRYPCSEISEISARLSDFRNSRVEIPGTDHVTISHVTCRFSRNCHCCANRFLKFHGTDGKEYEFSIERNSTDGWMRMMDIFNSFLRRENSKFQLETVPTISVSRDLCLLGIILPRENLWTAIRNFRENSRNPISFNSELSLQNKFSQNFNEIPLDQKLEIFEKVCKQVPGTDLRRNFWKNSVNAESWYSRRQNFTKSLACLSMVNYVTCLSSCNPSGLFILKKSNKVARFGFEYSPNFQSNVSVYWKDYVPFRLTRQLVNAMEISQVESTFKKSCEGVLEILQKFREVVAFMLKIQLGEDLAKFQDLLVPKATQRIEQILYDTEKLGIPKFVDRIIEEAKNPENLIQQMAAWNPYW